MPKAKEKKVVVKWKGNSREYSEKVHGKNYKDLATQFAEKMGGQVSDVE